MEVTVEDLRCAAWLADADLLVGKLRTPWLNADGAALADQRVLRMGAGGEASGAGDTASARAAANDGLLHQRAAAAVAELQKTDAAAPAFALLTFLGVSGQGPAGPPHAVAAQLLFGTGAAPPNLPGLEDLMRLGTVESLARARSDGQGGVGLSALSETSISIG